MKTLNIQDAFITDSKDYTRVVTIEIDGIGTSIAEIRHLNEMEMAQAMATVKDNTLDTSTNKDILNLNIIMALVTASITEWAFDKPITNENVLNLTDRFREPIIKAVNDMIELWSKKNPTIKGTKLKKSPRKSTKK